MSTLFLLDCNLQALDSNDSKTVKSKFQRVLKIPTAQQLFEKFYSDRIQRFPNKWNYETSVSIVILDDRAYSIQEFSAIQYRFFPTFNVKFVALSDFISNWKQIIEKVQNEYNLCKLRIKRMNHWMHHCHNHTTIQDHCKEKISVGNTRMRNNDSSTIYKGCEYGIYTMLDHLTNLRTANNRSKGVIPKIIKDIEFSTILSDFERDKDSLPHGLRDKDFYLDLFNSWDFSALNLTTRELIIGGYHLLHFLAQNAKIEISQNKLLLLLFTLESSYHQVNRFHNFKHAIDVMQATWNLCQILLPGNHELALLLCLAAIGHDIGHPGTNNSLFRDNSYLSVSFENTSILENFHFQTFHEVIKSIWPQVFDLSIKGVNVTDNNENITKNVILATDMSLHSNYVNILTKQKKSEMTIIDILSFIIKAADISNVTRPLNISAKWAYLITLEFKDCSNLQNFNDSDEDKNFSCVNTSKIVNIETEVDEDMNFEIELHNTIIKEPFQLSLLLENYPTIPRGQLFFIDTFAYDFFDKLSTKFPELKFLINNIKSNKEFWLSKVE